MKPAFYTKAVLKAFAVTVPYLAALLLTGCAGNVKKEAKEAYFSTPFKDGTAVFKSGKCGAAQVHTQ